MPRRKSEQNPRKSHPEWRKEERRRTEEWENIEMQKRKQSQAVQYTVMQCNEGEESWRWKNRTFDVEVGKEGKREGKSRSRERKNSEKMNSEERQRKWMKQWCERGILGNLNVTLATKEALIGDRVIVPRVKKLSAQGERKRLLRVTA